MDNPATFFFVFFAIFFAILGFGGGIITEYTNIRHLSHLRLKMSMKIFICIACFFFLVACFMSLPPILGSEWILGTIAVIIVGTIVVIGLGRLFGLIPNTNIRDNIRNIWNMNTLDVIKDKFRQIVYEKDV